MSERNGLKSAHGYWVLVILLAFFTAGCAQGKAQRMPAMEPSDPFGKLMVSEKPTQVVPAPARPGDQPAAGAEEEPSREQPQGLKHIAPPDPLLKAREVTKPPRLKPDTSPPVHVELAFDNADLYEVLDATLFELYKVNYIVDPSLRTKLTFHLAGEYTRVEFIDLLNNVLQLSGLAIVKGPGDTFKVVQRPSSAGAGNAPLVIEKQADAAGDITRLIKLRYVAAPTAANNIRPFLSKGAMVVPDTVNNALIISDTPENVDKAISILSVMDGEYFGDLSWQIFPAREVDAADMAADLSKVMKAGGLFNRPGVDQGSFEIFPIKTMNAILVVSRWPSILPLVEQWVSAMDRADESGTNVYVYFVENGSALEMSEILNELFGGKSRTTTKAKKTTIVAPEKKPEPKAEAPSGEIVGEVDIIPDETNNAIVIKASGRDYKIVKDVLRQLDVVPRQVLVTAVLAEVTLRGSLSYGVQWFLRGHAGEYDLGGTLGSSAGRQFPDGLATSDVFNFTVFDAADVLRALVTANEDDSSINIIASPNILVVDNKEAVIEVGDEIPTITGTITDTSAQGNLASTVQYRSTGVIMRVTPHINSSGLVKMDVAQEFSIPGDTPVGDTGNVSISTRKAQTSLVAESGQTIFIGGLIRSQLNTDSAGFPALRNVPVLGYLFGSQGQSTDKTELILLVTPYVVQNRSTADEISREFTGKVKSLKDRLGARSN
jgi:general secretion pathway protein D